MNLRSLGGLPVLLPPVLCALAWSLVPEQESPVAEDSASTVERVARAYFKAYEALDLEGVASFLAPDVRYEDPTASALGVDIQIEGKAAALDWLEQSFTRARDLKLVWHRQFFSGEHAVSWLTMSYRDATAVDLVTLDAVVVLRIVDGLIVQQIDYADYDSALRLRGAEDRDEGRDGGSPRPDDRLRIQASIEPQGESATSRWRVGDAARLVVDVRLEEGWAPRADLFVPRLRLSAPPCVRLDGPVVEEFDQLSSNDFLRKPFEVDLRGGTATIPLTLVAKPAPDRRLSFSVLAYVRPEKGEAKVEFERRRFEVSLALGAVAEESDSCESSWGSSGVLQIGDDMEVFELSRGDGSSFALEDLLFEKNLIVATQLAHW